MLDFSLLFSSGLKYLIFATQAVQLVTKFVASKPFAWVKRRLASGRRTQEALLEAIQDEDKYRDYRDALGRYVRLHFVPVDPFGQVLLENELAHSRTQATKYIQNFLEEKRRNNFSSSLVLSRHLLILGDSGMGKTLLLLDVFRRQYLKLARKKNESLVTFIALGTIGGDQEFQDLLQKLQKDPARFKKTLLFDAFDEFVASTISANALMALDRLLGATSGYRRVIITARSQTFSEKSQLTELLQNKNLAIPCDLRYIAPLSSQDQNTYIDKSLGLKSFGKRRLLQAILQSMGDLAGRPMLLSLVLERAKESPKGVLEKSFNTQFDLLSLAVDGWFKREQAWIKPENLREFSLLAAKKIRISEASNTHQTLAESDFDELCLLEKFQEIGRRKNTRSIFSTRSLLNRDVYGRLKFAHFSFLEYFLVLGYIQHDWPKESLAFAWTPQMKDLFHQAIRTKSSLPQKHIQKFLEDDHKVSKLLPSIPSAFERVIRKSRVGDQSQQNDLFAVNKQWTLLPPRVAHVAGEYVCFEEPNFGNRVYVLGRFDPTVSQFIATDTNWRDMVNLGQSRLRIPRFDEWKVLAFLFFSRWASMQASFPEKCDDTSLSLLSSDRYWAIEPSRVQAKTIFRISTKKEISQSFKESVWCFGDVSMTREHENTNPLAPMFQRHAKLLLIENALLPLPKSVESILTSNKGKQEQAFTLH